MAQAVKILGMGGSGLIGVLFVAGIALKFLNISQGFGNFAIGFAIFFAVLFLILGFVGILGRLKF
ncbi:MAG: hypothetical protein ACOCXG_05315 [Nanoarchaeota archaeon]